VLDIAPYKKTMNHNKEIQMKGAGKNLRERIVITILANTIMTRSILNDLINFIPPYFPIRNEIFIANDQPFLLHFFISIEYDALYF
jgi:hypothetical protein